MLQYYFIKSYQIEKRKIMTTSKYIKLFVINFFIFFLTYNIKAQTPPIVYVAGDGTGDYNCDGVSDQVQINQALDYVAANAGFTTVYLKGEFTYIIDEPVLMTSNTILTGDSTATIRLKDSVGWNTLYKPLISQKNHTGWDAWGVEGDSISNVEIYGFNIDGGDQAEPAGQGYIALIHFRFPYNISIYNMHLLNSRWDIVRLSASDLTSTHSNVYNNKIEYSGHEGICYVGLSNFDVYNNEIFHTRTNCGIRLKDCDTFDIHNNIIGNNLTKTPGGYTGILVENQHKPHTGQTEIYENIIYGKNGGIHIGSQQNHATYPIDSRINVRVHHNKIFKTRDTDDGSGFVLDAGIKIGGFQNTIIEHNVIEEGSTDAIVYEGNLGGSSGYETTVRNNIILNNDGYAINNKEPSINTFILNNNIIFNNTGGDYNNASSTTDIYSDPLFAGAHLPLNQWYHIVATYDNSTETFKIYVDGEEHTSKKIPGFGTIGTNTRYLFLGGYRAAAYWFKGKMDELAIWNRALTITEVNVLYNDGLPDDIMGSSIKTGMQAYFKMENNWNDSSGNNYNAIDSTASFATEAFNGNYAGLFDGIDDYVLYPNTLSTSDGLSISVWVNIGLSTESEQSILNKGKQESNNHIWLYIKNDCLIFELGNGSDRESIAAHILNPWDMDYHVKSKTGRWDKNKWVKDDVFSPCIDGGYPASDFSKETMPNGDTVNIGVYGNTAEASKSATHNYYVSPSGNNANSGLSIADAWETIAYAASSASPVLAGDTVFIIQGNYNERVLVEKSGTFGTNIVFTNYQNDEVTVDGTGISWGNSWNGLIDISNRKYVDISGLNVKNSDYGGIWVEDCDTIVIKNNKTYNTYSSGIGVWNSNNVRVENNEVELACNDGEQECISIANSHNCDILKNLVHDNGPGTNGGEGIDVKQGSHDVRVYQNTVHHLNERIGIYVDAWDQHTYNIDVFNNTVHHCGNNGFNAQTEMGGLLENVRFYNNISYFNKWDGIALGSVTADPNVTVTPVKHVKVINNTCYKNGSYQSGWGYGILVNNDDLQDVLIRNNICSRNSAQIAIENIDTISQVDHNLIFGYNDAASCVYGADSVIGDPLFVDTVTFDFHLQDNSPAIEAGIYLDSISFDRDSIPRSLLAKPDIGAYEYGIYWIGQVNNDWNEPGNWSNNQVPSSTDKVTIPPPEYYKYRLEVNVNSQIKAIYINKNAKMLIKENVGFDVEE